LNVYERPFNPMLVAKTALHLLTIEYGVGVSCVVLLGLRRHFAPHPFRKFVLTRELVYSLTENARTFHFASQCALKADVKPTRRQIIGFAHRSFVGETRRHQQLKGSTLKVRTEA
jgi:hypothetical protein